MGKAIIVVVPVVMAIYCLVDIAQTRTQQPRHLPRWAWVALIIVLPLLGSLGWLLLGRPRAVRRTTNRGNRGNQGNRASGRPLLAPDDDPDFLRRLRFKKPDDPHHP